MLSLVADVVMIFLAAFSVIFVISVIFRDFCDFGIFDLV